jgi:hypothetical protein
MCVDQLKYDMHMDKTKTEEHQTIWNYLEKLFTHLEKEQDYISRNKPVIAIHVFDNFMLSMLSSITSTQG